jgi:carbon-monoxide dehydrogenase medium subunit
VRNLKEYFRPSSAAEAVDIKRRYSARAVYLGGGSDLLVHNPPVEAAIDIRYAGIDGVREDGESLLIGGAARLCDVEAAAGDIGAGMLRQAVRDTAPWLIRNAATLAGNIANASPAADSIPALMALNAELMLIGDGSEERVAVFMKLARSKSDIAQVNVAVSLRRDGERATDVRIALGAVAPVHMRAESAEALVEGKPLDSGVLHAVEQAVSEEVRPITDWRASADYRRRMSGILARRALLRAFALTGTGGKG